MNGFGMFDADTAEFLCPKCGCDCDRDSVHSGLALIYGPYGCPDCGWSEDERFDISAGPKQIDGMSVDQYGNGYPKRASK